MKTWNKFERIKSADLNANFDSIADGTGIQDNAIDTSKVTTEEWIAPTLLNSWANYGSDHPPAGYMKTPDGTVHLRGLIRFGSSNTAVMFTLPAGYRPGTAILNTTVNANHATGSARVDIVTTGNVYQDASNGSTGWVSLSGISFKAEE